MFRTRRSGPQLAPGHASPNGADPRPYYPVMRITWGRGALATALLVAVGAGCGGGGDDADSSGSSTTEAKTTSTLSAAAEASEAAVIELSDLGTPWKEHTPAKGITPAAPDSCMAKAGIYAAVAEDGRYQGATFQRGTASYYVQSNAVTFPDEDAARAMTERLTTDEHARCQAERRSAQAVAAPDAPEGAAFRVVGIAEVPAEGGDGGYAGSVQYQFQAMTDGRLQDANGFMQENVFRNGRTVLHVTLESLFSESDAADLDTHFTQETTKAARQAIARASG